jgi:hypothetical protein
MQIMTVVTALTVAHEIMFSFGYHAALRCFICHMPPLNVQPFGFIALVCCRPLFTSSDCLIIKITTRPCWYDVALPLWRNDHLS